jgi:hypothetical protein
VIRVGSRVSALIGELGYWNGPPPEVDANGKKRNQSRERFFGTVIKSKPDRKWLVRWDRSGVVSEDQYSTYKLKYEGPGSDLRPTNQEAAQEERLQAAAAVERQRAAQQRVQQGAAATEEATRPVQQQAPRTPA